jgi:hypothetical protein
MNIPLTVAVLLLLLTTFPTAAFGQKKCSCKAADGGCEAEAICRDGGAAICGSNRTCYVACGGVDPENSLVRISLKIKNKSSEEVTAALRNKSKKNIVFTSRRKTDRFTFELKNQPLWPTLEFLSKRGKVFLDGLPFDRHKDLRRKLSGGGKVSIDFTDLPVRSMVARLSFLSGVPLRVESGDAERLLSISLEEMTVGEMVTRISAETGVKIEHGRVSASIK